MRKKFVLFGLVLVLLTAGIMFGSLVYITNMVLPKGSAEEFAALPGPADSELYRAEEKLHGGGSRYVVSNYLKERPDDSKLRQQLGGAQWVEQPMDNYALFYVTEPSHELREQIQEKLDSKYMEVALAKCDFSLQQLREALDALDVYLLTAPESVRESVQISLFSPRKNRVAVYVKDWNIFDQLNLAKAMGPMCPRLYVVEENLDEALPQMEFIHFDNWCESELYVEWSEISGNKELISEEELYRAGEKKLQLVAEYRLCMELTYGVKNWRMAGLIDSIGAVAQINCFMMYSYMKGYDGGPIADLVGVRPAHLSDDESYTFYEEWTPLQERLVKAILYELKDFDCPMVMLHSY